MSEFTHFHFPDGSDMPPPSFSSPGTAEEDTLKNGKKKKHQNGEHVPSVRLNEETQEVFNKYVERRVPVRSAISGLMALQRDDEKKMIKFIKQYGGPLDTQALVAYIQSKKPEFTLKVASPMDRADEIIEGYGMNALEH